MVKTSMSSILLSLPAVSVSESFCQQPGWQVVWEDDFEGTKLNPDNWNVMEGGDAGTLRAATGTREDVWVEDGNLVLRSRLVNGSLFSGAVVSAHNPVHGDTPKGNAHQSWMYGRYCVSAKLPGVQGNSKKSQGIWPAHWMLPDVNDCWPTKGEIDILEMINGDGNYMGHYHFTGNGSCLDDASSGVQTPGPATWASEYHEYAVEWDADHIDYLVDGQLMHTVRHGDASMQHKNPVTLYPVKYYWLLNTAIGGEGDWSGPIGPETVFPAYHRIDVVRVSKPAAQLV